MDIDMRYKPRHLPQVSAPYTHVVGELEKEGIDWELLDIDPEEINPMQGIVFSDEVGNFDTADMDPVWLSKDNDLMDGHHRFLGALMKGQPLKGVRIGMNGRDGCRMLNKIQDIYEYQEQQGLEEVEMQNILNTANSADSGVSDNEFLAMLEGATEAPEGTPSKIVGYRQQPIKENSVIGNFFLIEPVEGYDKYEIEFDNLLDTENMGVNLGDENPVDTLAKSWFPHADFEKLGEEMKIAPIHLKNKAIAERCGKMGYDGIKYGNKMLQGLK